MNPAEQIEALSHRIAEAIGRRDVAWLRQVLAPGFVHRTPEGDATDADAFLGAIAGIQVEILSVSIECVAIDMSDFAALATGTQVARVRVDGQEISDRRRFVDWFVKVGAEWRLKVAIDLGDEKGPDPSLDRGPA